MRQQLIISISAIFVFQLSFGQQKIVLSQNEKSVLIEKMGQIFQATELEINYQVSSYSSHTSLNKEDEQKGRIIYSDQSSKTEFGDLTTYTNKDIIVSVSKTDKKIYLKNSNLKKGLEFRKTWIESVKSEYVITQEIVDGKISIEITMPQGSDFEKLKYVLDEKYILLKSIIYYRYPVEANSGKKNSIKSKPRIEVEFKSISPPSNGYLEIIDIQNVITFDKGSPILSKEYKSFELIDSRKK